MTKGKKADDIRGRSQTTLTKRGRYIGDTENINGMQIFPYSNSKVPYKCQPGVGRWSKGVKLCSKILPLKVWVLPATKAPNCQKDSSMAIEFLCFVLPEKRG